MSMGSGINIATRLSQQVLRNQIVERRSRLENATAKVNDASLQGLFDQVDAALHKILLDAVSAIRSIFEPLGKQNPRRRASHCLQQYLFGRLPQLAGQSSSG